MPIAKQLHETDVLIGKRLRLARLAKHISQAHLATQMAEKISEDGSDAKFSFQQIQKYENGVNRIAVSTLMLIAEVLETPVTFFLDDKKKWGECGISTPSILDLSPSTLRAIHGLEQLPPSMVALFVRLFDDLAAIEKGEAR